MKLFKFLIILFSLFLLVGLSKSANAQSTACGSCPDGSGRACTNWSPPGAMCTNNDWWCNSCAPCATPPPVVTCPDVGWGSSPGSYCGSACVSCGVTSDRYYDANCNCVSTGTYSDPSYCTQMCPTPPPATATPTNPPPPPTCPNNQCSNGETCSTCPQDCGSCQPPQTCPDGVCNAGEYCGTCPQDCGACQVPPTATPRTPTATRTPTPPSAPTATRTPTPTVPACNSPCSNPASCIGAQNNCTYCNPSTNKCETPPACNTDCTADPNICTQAGGGCTVCSPTTKRCVAPPTATPTATRTPTPTATRTPTPTATNTPTPTPFPFSENMCKCDGIDYTSLALGQPATITAYGKVEGVEQNYAKITDFKFLFIKGNDPTKQDIVIPQTTIPAVIALQNDQMTRYKADWKIDLPSNLSTADTYRITAKMTCVRKAQAAVPNVQTNRVVLGSSAQPVSLWDRVVGFFANLFGGGQSAVAVPTPTPTLTPEQQKQLQLKTFIPARGISTDNCTFIRFNF